MKKDYVWNTLAGLINAAEAVIMSMIVTRVTGLSDAGYLTLAFAVGNLLASVGKYGVRSFQVTDVHEQFIFSDYFWTRIITVFLMLISLLSYVLYGKFFRFYETKKCLIVLLIGLIYIIESVEDVFWGFYQNKNRLYLGAQIFSFRWIGILMSFFVTILYTKSIVIALGISCIISALVLTFGLILISNSEKVRFSIARIRWESIKDILISCFPLFLTTFLSFYVANSPKYALDCYVSAEVQACYGFVAMPIFVIGLLNSFIYQPVLVTMSKEYSERNAFAFKRRIKIQIMVLLGVTAVCLLGAFAIGIPVLSWLYHTDLSAYLNELLILLLAGGFLALSGYFTAVLTIMRCQKDLLLGYIPVSVIAFLFMNLVAKKYGTMGVAVAYLVLMFLLSSVYLLFVRLKMKKTFSEEIDSDE